MVNPRQEEVKVSSEDASDNAAVIDFEALAARNFEAAQIESEQVQDGRVQVGDIMSRFDGVEAQFVGRAVDMAALQASTRQPDRKAVRMMIAPVRSSRTLFQAGSAAKFGGEDDDATAFFGCLRWLFSEQATDGQTIDMELVAGAEICQDEGADGIGCVG